MRFYQKHWITSSFFIPTQFVFHRRAASVNNDDDNVVVILIVVVKDGKFNLLRPDLTSESQCYAIGSIESLFSFCFDAARLLPPRSIRQRRRRRRRRLRRLFGEKFNFQLASHSFSCISATRTDE